MLRRRTLFLAGPLTALLQSDTEVLPDVWRRRYSLIINIFESEGWDVRNAHRREAWGAHLMPPAEHVNLDFAGIQECNLFVAFPGYPPSPGTHIEIGWASALRKPIILLLEADRFHCSLVTELASVADVRTVVYRDDNDYLEQLRKEARVAHAQLPLSDQCS